MLVPTPSARTSARVVQIQRLCQATASTPERLYRLAIMQRNRARGARIQRLDLKRKQESDAMYAL